jgi:hypothetical protein
MGRICYSTENSEEPALPVLRTILDDETEDDFLLSARRDFPFCQIHLFVYRRPRDGYLDEPSPCHMNHAR